MTTIVTTSHPRRLALLMLAVLGAFAAFASSTLVAAEPTPYRVSAFTLGDDTQLEEVASQLERLFPATRVLVEARTGGSRHPVIPRIAMRNATLSEALKMITTLVPVVLSTTETIGETTVVKLRSTGDELTRTTILPLNVAIDRILGRAADPTQRKQALDSILSMIRAVSDQTRSPFGLAQLKVHEETELLIANGTEDQLKVISNALGQASVGPAPVAPAPVGPPPVAPAPVGPAPVAPAPKNPQP